jgi:hypothetical protein
MKLNKKESDLEDYKNQVSEILQKFLKDLDDDETLQEIIQIMDENQNNTLELNQLKKLLTVIDTKEFQKVLTTLQNENLTILIEMVNMEIKKLERMTVSDFFQSIKNKRENRTICILSSGCCGVKKKF